MSIIEAIRDYLRSYSGLEYNAPVWANFLGARATEYSVVPLGGDKIIERYLDGGSQREYGFALQSAKATGDNLTRLENLGFFEAFGDWLDAQTLAGVFPALGAKQDALRIEATGWGYLMEQGQSETGIYQVNCKLTYFQSV
jgi:hypothetical protein